MKLLAFIISFAAASALRADFLPQQIVCVESMVGAVDFGPISRWLNGGYKVVQMTSEQLGATSFVVIVVLDPPAPEVAAALEAKMQEARRIAWEKKKAEYEASKPKLEKETNK